MLVLNLSIVSERGPSRHNCQMEFFTPLPFKQDPCAYRHTDKESKTERFVDQQLHTCVWRICWLMDWWWPALSCTTKKHHGVTLMTGSIGRHLYIWQWLGVTTCETPVSSHVYLYIPFYWWTRQRIHDTLIVLAIGEYDDSRFPIAHSNDATWASRHLEPRAIDRVFNNVFRLKLKQHQSFALPVKSPYKEPAI